jgi:tetratricopeptide (TPR) repeat protein
MMNPFFLRDLDRPYFVQWVISAVNDGRRRGGAPPLTAADQVELDYAIEGLIRTGLSFRGRANLAASQRQFDEALGLYNRALSGSRDKPGIRWNRARIFYLMGAADSALNELQLAVNELREKDAAKLSLWYRSKEFYEHAMGMIHERRGDLAGAKEAYGRALQEHLSYYPAHVRLAALALRAGDTIQALSEFELAAQVAPNEPLVRLTYGALLAQTGKADDAEPHLRRVVELEPFFATPHYLLGRVAEQKGNTDGATQEYQAFLRLASKKDVRRGDVTQRLADIRE